MSLKSDDIQREEFRRRQLEVVGMIIDDAESDANKLDGRPFNGKEVAEIFGETLALIQALGKIVKSILEEME